MFPERVDRYGCSGDHVIREVERLKIGKEQRHQGKNYARPPLDIAPCNQYSRAVDCR